MDRGIPQATVGRLPVYLRALSSLEAGGVQTVSSAELAEASGVNPAQVRKDLTHLRSSGTRGVGYDVGVLSAEIRGHLGLEQHWPVIIAGAGHLGQALANYAGFGERGFQVVAVVDSDPARVGQELAGVAVEPIDRMRSIVIERGASIGVICVPAQAAQEVADEMVGAGINSILNFAPVPLMVPAGVEVRKVDLSVELQILTFHEQRRASQASPA